MGKCLMQYQSQFSAISFSFFTSMTSTKTSIQKLGFFANDYVLYRDLNSNLDFLELQQEIQKLVDWSHTWQMSFNINKCHLTCPQKETAHHTHLHNGQHPDNTSHTAPISWH